MTISSFRENATHLIATLTILNSQTASEVIEGDRLVGYEAISISTKETVLTGTVTAQMMPNPAADNEALDASWAAIQSPPGTDVTIGAQKAVVLTMTPFGAFRLLSGAAEAADRVFYVWGQRRHA